MTTHGLLSTLAAALYLLLSASGAESTAKTEHLKDLGDGESKTYGSGEHKVTATRDGDVITLTLPAGKDGKARTMKIALDDGDATLMTVEEGDASDVKGKVIVIKKKVRVDGDGDETVTAHAISAGDGFAYTLGDECLTWIGEGDSTKAQRLLRCPKGDTSMHVEKDDTGTYYCPKHNVALEEVKGKHVAHRTLFLTDDKDEKDDKNAKPEASK